MLQKFENTDEIMNYFEETRNRGGFPYRLTMTQFYNAGLTIQEQQEKEKRITDQIKNEYYRVLEIHIINDDFQIVKLVNRRKTEDQTEWYSIFYQYRELHEFYPTFDNALVALLCAKHQNSTQPAQWIVKMLQMNEDTNMNE